MAQLGYETLAASTLGLVNQPAILIKFPQEQFEDLLAYVPKNTSNDEPITVLGTSMGAEYAFHFATEYDVIDNVVLIAPSAYTFFGLNFKNHGSSWIGRAKRFFFVNVQKSSFLIFITSMLIPSVTESPSIPRGSYNCAVEVDTYIRSRLRIPEPISL
ncbi:hypothetical protein [Corynebacterium sp. ES2715-CONJ3]|uniref:hypothetical protein n=1 Tax=Corynebacterium sp. ES2715-CONJ3 TaxID=2974028 RepID=UPI0037BFA37F